MIKAVLFPSEVLSIHEVDSCYKDEYEAAVNTEGLEIIFYDYEQFVNEGILRLSRKVEEKTLTVLRGWMLKPNLYERFYNLLLERNVELLTTPTQYKTMHLFPYVYPYIKEDTPRILIFREEPEEVDLEEIKQNFERFMVKDFVKSEKGTDFPKYFDNSVSKEDFKHWLEVFKEYRGKLFTGGICIKEYVDLKRYGDNTNEWRVFYANGNVISVSRNSGQKNYEIEVPKELINKYRNLDSPFYTIDYAELSDGTWRILEAGDGQVSGLSDNQNAASFFRSLQFCEKNICLGCQRLKTNQKIICPFCLREIAEVNRLIDLTIEYKCPTGNKFATTYWAPCEEEARVENKDINSREGYISYVNDNRFSKGDGCPYV